MHTSAHAGNLLQTAHRLREQGYAGEHHGREHGLRAKLVAVLLLGNLCIAGGDRCSCLLTLPLREVHQAGRTLWAHKVQRHLDVAAPIADLHATGASPTCRLRRWNVLTQS